MSNPGISSEFVNQISQQFQLLQQHSALQDQNLLSELSNQVQLLLTEHLHEPATGISPPEDQVVPIHNSSSSETPTNKVDTLPREVSKDDIQSIQQTNDRMRQEIDSTLLAFRQANDEYMRAGTLERTNYGEKILIENEGRGSPGNDFQLDRIMERINTLQQDLNSTNTKIVESESLIMTRETENLGLMNRISEIERNLLNKGQSKKLCHCLII